MALGGRGTYTRGREACARANARTTDLGAACRCVGGSVGSRGSRGSRDLGVACTAERSRWREETPGIVLEIPEAVHRCGGDIVPALVVRAVQGDLLLDCNATRTCRVRACEDGFWAVCDLVLYSSVEQPKKPAVVKGGKPQAKKKSLNKFVIDCTTAETDSILDCSNFVRCPPVPASPPTARALPLRCEQSDDASAFLLLVRVSLTLPIYRVWLVAGTSK